MMFFCLSGQCECGGVREDDESLPAKCQPGLGSQVTQVKLRGFCIFLGKKLDSVHKNLKVRNEFRNFIYQTLKYFRQHFSEHFEHDEVSTNVNVLEDQGNYNSI